MKLRMPNPPLSFVLMYDPKPTDCKATHCRSSHIYTSNIRFHLPKHVVWSASKAETQTGPHHNHNLDPSRTKETSSTWKMAFTS